MRSLSRLPPYLAAFFATITVVLNSGCATIGQGTTRVPSHAIANGTETTLGKAFSGSLGEHPGQSGFVILSTGSAALHARVELADAAQLSLDLQYFSATLDASTELLGERLVAAARRGVRVRILLDDIEDSSRDFVSRLAAVEPTIQVRLFNPFSSWPLPSVGRALELLADFDRLNRRMHNKLWVADNAAAIFGSRNLGNAYFDAAGSGDFSDLDLLAIGPVVDDLSRVFDVYWNSNAAAPFVPPAVAAPAVTAEAGVDAVWQEGLSSEPGESAGAQDCCLRQMSAGESSFVWGQAEVAYDPPDGLKLTARYDLQHGMPDDPAAVPTRSELLFISPYFIPSEAGLRHMGEMNRRGLRVAVLTNSLASTDTPAAHAGYARYRGDLLRYGVELYEYRPEPSVQHEAPHLWPRSTESSLHAKLIVVDRRRSIVGSLNQDPRSRLHNTESWVSIDSPELAERLALFFDEGTHHHHAFRVQLRSDALEWSSYQDGVEQLYFSEPLASLWRRILSKLSALVVPEDLL